MKSSPMLLHTSCQYVHGYSVCNSDSLLQSSSDEVFQLRAQLLTGKKELARLKLENEMLNSKLETLHSQPKVH